MIERNARDTLKQWAKFLNSHRGGALSLADLGDAVDYYRLYPWLAWSVRMDAALSEKWAAAIHCALLPGLRDLLAGEGECYHIDTTPLFTSFELLAEVGDAVKGFPKPKAEPDNARWPDEYHAWPDSFGDTLAGLSVETRKAVRDAEAILQRLRVHIERKPIKPDEESMAILKALDNSPILLGQEDIAAGSGVDRKTVGAKLPDMIRYSYIYRKGVRGGYGVTDLGKTLIPH